MTAIGGQTGAWGVIGLAIGGVSKKSHPHGEKLKTKKKLRGGATTLPVRSIYRFDHNGSGGCRQVMSDHACHHLVRKMQLSNKCG